jgi:AraC-like DNA-binding protein
MNPTKNSSVPSFILGAVFRGVIGAVCVSGVIGVINAQTPAPSPALVREPVILKPGAASLARGAPAQSPRLRAITADSARILTPWLRSVITGCPAVYEIAPMLPVDSAMLFVRHSGGLIDTLAVLSAPPYRATWECAGVPDQDPAHLQFGYILYIGDSLTVASPPMPHVWALLRGGGFEKKGRTPYRVKRLAAANGFEVDCDTLKWNGAEGADIANSAGGGAGGAGATFKMFWTGAKLYFIARVRDSAISGGDFVELHIDMRRDRVAFPGIEHRSLRFSPLGRAIFFAGEFADGKYAPSDSIVRLLTDEAEWKASIDSGGYTVEAAIPFSILSSFDFPLPKFGFDVSVMDADGETESFYSWAGSGRFARYSPSVWGTARMKQAVPALRFVLFFALFISGFAIIGFVAYLFFSHRQEGKELKAETDNASPVTEAAIEEIDKQLSNANLKIGDISKAINKSAGEIAAALTADLGCTFERQLEYKRVKRSQKLMRVPELSIEEIAARCGFADADAYRKSYIAQMRVAPEVSREAMLERVREDLEAESDDDDDDAL